MGREGTDLVDLGHLSLGHFSHIQRDTEEVQKTRRPGTEARKAAREPLRATDWSLLRPSPAPMRSHSTGVDFREDSGPCQSLQLFSRITPLLSRFGLHIHRSEWHQTPKEYFPPRAALSWTWQVVHVQMNMFQSLEDRLEFVLQSPTHVGFLLEQVIGSCPLWPGCRPS